MTDMEGRELKAEDVPMGYPLCFNNECADKNRCMHYQARLLMPKDHYSGAAVYPTAWEDSKCRCFCEKKLVKKAWGFTKLYDNVPPRQKAEAASVFTHYSVAETDRIIGRIMVRLCFRHKNRKRF